MFKRTRTKRYELHKALEKIFGQTPDFARVLGLDPKAKFEVHALRRSNRVGPDGNPKPQVVVVLTQSQSIEIEGTPEKQTFRGGSTIIVDLAKPRVQYAIIKNINSERRQKRTTEFLKAALEDPVQALLLAPGQQERFAALHALAEIG